MVPKKEEFESLILTYMIHHGYSETALSLFRSETKQLACSHVSGAEHGVADPVGVSVAKPAFIKSFQTEDEILREISLVKHRKGRPSAFLLNMVL